MRNEVEDAKQQALQMAKEQAKQAAKEALKKVGTQIVSVITPYLPYIIIAVIILVIIVGCIDWDNIGETESSSSSSVSGSNSGYSTAGGTSIFYDESFTKEEFIEKVNAYNPGHILNQSTGVYLDDGYKKGFIDVAGDYFDISVKYGFDPRVTFCTGIQESYYGTSKICIDKCNYWGLGASDSDPYNNAHTYDSIQMGIESLCQLLKNYTTEGTTFNKMILNKGYDPTTIQGVGSIYASDGTWAAQKIQHMRNIFGFVETVDTSSFLATAKSIWNVVCNEFNTYGPTNIVPNSTSIDCSSFVSWVLYEYGYKEFQGTQKTTNILYNTNWNDTYGWTEIAVGEKENVIDKVKPGDILVRYSGTNAGQVHHVTIIEKVENGQVYVYDCGDANNWKNKNGNPTVYTSFITASTSNTQAPGKIIRVTKPK